MPEVYLNLNFNGEGNCDFITGTSVTASSSWRIAQFDCAMTVNCVATVEIEGVKGETAVKPGSGFQQSTTLNSENLVNFNQ